MRLCPFCQFVPQSCDNELALEVNSHLLGPLKFQMVVTPVDCTSRASALPIHACERSVDLLSEAWLVQIEHACHQTLESIKIWFAGFISRSYVQRAAGNRNGSSRVRKARGSQLA